MPNTVTRRVIEEGPRNIVVHLYLASDGAEGEVINYPIVDKASLNPVMPSGARLAIEKLWYSISGFDLTLAFDNLVDVPVWIITPGHKGHISFLKTGGIKDPGGADNANRILVSTNGFTSTDDRGVIILMARKS